MIPWELKKNLWELSAKKCCIWKFQNLDIFGQKMDNFKLKIAKNKKSGYFGQKLPIEKLDFPE